MSPSDRNPDRSSRQNPNKRSRGRRRRHFPMNPIVVLIALATVLFLVILCAEAMLAPPGGSGENPEQTSSNPPAISDSASTPGSTPDTNPPETTDPDVQAPVLDGVHDFLIYQGDTISYMRGISATDDRDSNPTITVDNSAVDLSKPGEYQVTYTAADAAGNASHATATVTILEKQENFVELDTIYDLVDAKLEEIIPEDASTEQQVNAIYRWARNSLGYSGHSDRTDFRQTAYVMLTDGRGDCYGYFAVTKLMMERLGIPNIDVQKVRNYPDDSDHFWSLVSLDGGETWYHFDATPRVGEGDDFCLVTDAFLNAYSDSHKGSHNRDQSLYPATP